MESILMDAKIERAGVNTYPFAFVGRVHYWDGVVRW